MQKRTRTDTPETIVDDSADRPIGPFPAFSTAFSWLCLKIPLLEIAFLTRLFALPCRDEIYSSTRSIRIFVCIYRLSRILVSRASTLARITIHASTILSLQIYVLYDRANFISLHFDFVKTVFATELLSYQTRGPAVCYFSTSPSNELLDRNLEYQVVISTTLETTRESRFICNS